MKKSLIILTIFFVLPLVYSSSFEIQENPKDLIAFDGENAQTILTIKNNEPSDINFKIDSVDFNWLLNSKLDLVSINVPAFGSKDIPLTFEPLSDIQKKTYGVKLIVTASDGTKIEKLIQITSANLNDVFDIEVRAPEQIDPRKKDTKVELEVKNNFDNDYRDLSIVLSSDIISETKVIDLFANEVKTEYMTWNVKDDAEGGDHDIQVSFYYNNKLVGQNNMIVKIEQYDGVRDILTPENSFLIKREVTKKINNGNFVAIQEFTKKLSLIQNLFTKTEPNPEVIVKEDGSYILTWNLRLNPGDEVEIVVTTNYRTPLLILILILAIGTFAYLRLKTDLVIHKKVLTVKSAKGINKMRVLLTIKNKSKRNITNIRAMDRVNNVIDKPYNFGTIDPFKVSNTGRGYDIIWKINNLNAGSEVIISYNVESKMNVIGNLLLPPALVRYIYKERTIIARSNRIMISR